jgi:outer membrane protein
MCRILRLSAVIIFMIFGLTLKASGEVYTLEKCIETALQNNYGVIAAKNNYEATRWSLYSAYGEILPSVSISTARSENWATGRQIDEYGREYLISGKTVSYGGNLSFRQSYAGLGIGTYANIRQSHAQRQYYYFNYLNTGKNLILSVKEAYYNVVKAKMLVDVSGDAVRRNQEQLRVAESKYELGSASLSDVLKAKVSYNNARLDLINAENSFNLSLANLNYTMGIDVSQEVEVEEDFPHQAFEISYEQALAEALFQNPSFKQSQYDLEMAKYDLLMAKTAFLPAFSVSLSHSTSADESKHLFDFERERARYNFGVSLSFNIFNNLSDVSSVVSSKKNVSSKKENLDNTQNSVALEVKESFLDVQTNVEKMNFTEESVAAAQEDLNIVREKYKLGAATIIEVLDAEVTFKQAQINKVEALFDYNLAVSRLEKVMGR